MRWVLGIGWTFDICHLRVWATGGRHLPVHSLARQFGSLLSREGAGMYVLTTLSSKLIPSSCARRPHWSALTTNHCRIGLRSPACRTSNTVSRSLGRPSSALGRWLLVRNQPTRQTGSLGVQHLAQLARIVGDAARRICACPRRSRPTTSTDIISWMDE